MKFAAVFLCAVVAVVAATTPFNLEPEYVQFVKRTSIPSYYKQVDLPRNADWAVRPVTFTILLKQKNLDVLEDLFWKVSNPKHEMYAKYLTAEEIHQLTETAPEIKESVLDWIHSVYKATGIQSLDFQIVDRRDALRITAPVAFVEALLKTTLAPFKRTTGNYNGHLWIKYIDTISVPKHLDQHIDLITGIVEFAPIPQGVRIQKSKARGTFLCNIPYTMKLMYSIPENKQVQTQQASQAPYSEVGNRGEGFGADDLAQFQQINGLADNPITNIIGDDASAYVDANTDTEACLDVQCLTGFGVAANTSFWVMNDWMYEFANEILNTEDPPLVNSMSYGWYESQQCRIDGNCANRESSEDYVTRTDVEFQKIGVLGITMLAASGDDGTESDRNCDEMRPDYPASSVYVTSVGATAVVNDHMSNDTLPHNAPPVCSSHSYNCDCSTSTTEHAASSGNNAGFDSGGGFSQWLDRPDYQKNAVQAYFDSGVTLPSSQYWNTTNRGYPDVAAVGASVLIIKNGRGEKVGGTSASTPIWGGIISLLNSDRIQAGKAPLGFINQLLYQMYADQPSAYNDITVGKNGGGCSNLAFQCAEGWDPVTGLGTPVFDVISDYVSNLP